MPAAADWLGGGATSVLGWTLIHTLWQAGLVAGTLVLVLRIIPGVMTRLRTAAASGALALVLALAVVVWLGLAADWQQHAVCWQSGEYAGQHPATCASHGVSPPAGASVSMASKPRAVLPWAWISSGEAPLALTATRGMSLIVILWGAVTTLALARLLVDLHLLRGVIRRSRPMADAGMLTLLDRVQERMGIHLAVDLGESADVGTPAVAGWRPPIILLPCGMSGALEPEQLECVLAHELVHIRRRHFAVNLAQRMLECVFVWNPFALWMSRRLRDEREALCDAAAAGPPAAGARRRYYAETLLRLERLRTPTRAALVGLLGEGPLLRRIRRLTDAATPSQDTCARRACAAGIAALIALLVIAQISVTSMAVSSWAVMKQDISTREHTPVVPVAGKNSVN
jgi:beta-lactamase regulating signal transducer with metallopeptidase domain